jgi:hypothetical protein
MTLDRCFFWPDLHPPLPHTQPELHKQMFCVPWPSLNSLQGILWENEPLWISSKVGADHSGEAS